GIAVWELASSLRWEFGAPDIIEGALSPDGMSAIAVDARGVLHALDANGDVQHRPLGPNVSCVGAFPGGQRAATCGPGDRVVVWDLATGQQLVDRPAGAVSWIVLSRDGGAMFASNERDTTGWLLAGDLSRKVRLDHDARLNDATFSPDGAR